MTYNSTMEAKKNKKQKEAKMNNQEKVDLIEALVMVDDFSLILDLSSDSDSDRDKVLGLWGFMENGITAKEFLGIVDVGPKDTYKWILKYYEVEEYVQQHASQQVVRGAR